MNSFAMTSGLLLLALLHTSMAGIIPAALPAAPIVAAAPAAIGYTRAVPYNIPPYASRVDINTRNIASPYVAAAPYIAAAPAALPYAALPSAPLIAAPGVYPSAYAGSFAAPLAPAAYAI